MAEPRRVVFSTLTPPGPAPAPAPAPPPPPPAPVRKKRREERGANGNVRLQLSLSEPSDRSSTEYSYSELLREARKNSANADDPFNAEEKERKEVEALAKKFEEKYGQKNHKRRKDRMQDLIDMGYGYDETDPFIDNSEAYDELVPASLTTKYGGFYINAGTLQFRQTSDTEDEDGAGKKKLKSPKKQKFKDGEDRISKKQKRRDESGIKDKKPKKLKVSKESGVVALNASKVSKKKRRNHSDSLSLAEMLRKFQKEKDAMKRHEVGVKPLPGPQQPDQAPKNSSLLDCIMPATDPLSLLGSSNEHDLMQEAASAIDLLADLDIEKLLAETPSGSPTSEPEESSSAGTSSPAGSLLHTPRDAPEPPEGLPTQLEKRIGDLKMAAKVTEGEGKKKFFTSDINAILLDIELQVQELSLTVRSGVYAYLVSFMPCSKDALMKRLKRLHLNEQDERLREPLIKLKEAVGKVMPEQILRFQEELQAHTQARFAKTVSEEERDRNGSDDEDEEKPGRRVTGPRKKFTWNDYVRELLCNLVKIKLGCYKLEPNKMQSVEDYLKTFLETEVKPIWPRGWMQSRLLFKESKRVHYHLTAVPTKKKVIFAPKPKLKDSSPKREIKLSPPLGPGARPASGSPLGGVCASGRETICLDDSLDEELPLKPPSLESVSEALAVFTGSAKSHKETPNCVSTTARPQLLVKPETKAPAKVTPPSTKNPSPTSPATLSFSQIFSHGGAGAKKPQEGVRSGLSSLIAGYTAPSAQGTHKPPGGSGIKQQQQQHSQARPSQSTQTVKPQPSLRHPVFLSSPLPVGKCHANPVVKLSACPLHVIANHTQKASEKPASSLQSGFPQSSSGSGSHGLTSRASPGPSTSSAYKAAATSGSTSMQGFKPVFTTAKASSSSPGCAGLVGQSGLATGSHGNRQASGKHLVSQSLARHQQPGSLVRKPSVPQKQPSTLGPGGGAVGRSSLPSGGVRGSPTLSAGRSGGPGISATASRSGGAGKTTVSTSTGPTNRNPLNRNLGMSQGAVNRTVAGGAVGRTVTGVAVSRTSVSVAAGTTGALKMLPSPHRTSSTSGVNITGAGVQATSSSAILPSTPPLALMTSPLNVTSPNVSSASLNSAAFGMLGGLVPVSLPFQFPLNLLSFGADPSSPASVSAGTTSAAFQHNMNILKGLQSTSQGSRSAVPSQLQHAYTDGNKSQGDSSKRKSL